MATQGERRQSLSAIQQTEMHLDARLFVDELGWQRLGRYHCTTQHSASGRCVRLTMSRQGPDLDTIRVEFRAEDISQLNPLDFKGLKEKMADGVGFEPTVRFHARRFSRPVPSTARPPIQRIEIKTDSVISKAAVTGF